MRLPFEHIVWYSIFSAKLSPQTPALLVNSSLPKLLAMMNMMMDMGLRLNINVLHRDCDQLYHEQYDEHRVKTEHYCFT